MTSIPHEPSGVVRDLRRPSLPFLVPEMWASLAIVVMWLSVLLDALFGPDIESTTVAGDHTRVPSAVVLALFAFLGTWVVARHGFRREEKE